MKGIQDALPIFSASIGNRANDSIDYLIVGK